MESKGQPFLPACANARSAPQTESIARLSAKTRTFGGKSARPSSMSQSDQQIMISALQRLSESAKDGENGFKAAAEECADAKLKQLFLDWSIERGLFATELKGLLQQAGSDGDERGWMAGSSPRSPSSRTARSSLVAAADFRLIHPQCRQAVSGCARNPPSRRGACNRTKAVRSYCERPSFDEESAG